MKIYVENLLNEDDVLNIDANKTIIFENSSAKFRIRFAWESLYINKIATDYRKDNDIIKIEPISRNGVGIE